MNAARKNSSLTPKKAVKHAENSNVSDACRLCGINFKISVGDFGGKNKYVSTENLFKIPQRAGVDKIPLADLLKIHLDVEVDPQDGKSSCVCAKCTLKIRNASSLINFIRTAVNRENTDEESLGEQRLKRMSIVSPQRKIKNLVHIAHHLLRNSHPFPGKSLRIYRLRNARCCSVRGSSQTLQPQSGNQLRQHNS